MSTLGDFKDLESLEAFSAGSAGRDVFFTNGTHGLEGRMRGKGVPKKQNMVRGHRRERGSREGERGTAVGRGGEQVLASLTVRVSVVPPAEREIGRRRLRRV